MELVRLELASPPLIGKTAMGQKIHLGGFSGLRFLGRSPTGLFKFVTITDRGPNADERVSLRGQERPFGLPDFQPRLVFLDADLKLKKFYVSRELPLRHNGGKPVSGRPPPENSEVAVDFKGQTIGADENGLDLESIAIAPDGSFWLADEYGPSLVHFSKDGTQIEQLVPGKSLPESFRYRRMNRGFEGVAFSNGNIYAALESPLDNPPSEGEKNSRKSRITRIVEVDGVRKVAVAQFAYVLEESDTGKLSDITMDGPDRMLVVEKGGSGAGEWKRVYRIYIPGATNLQRLSSAISGPGGSLESLTPQELAKNGIVPVRKELVLDLSALGILEEKIEGIDRVDEKTIAVITDNDFGLAGGLERTEGFAETKDEVSALYFLPLD